MYTSYAYPANKGRDGISIHMNPGEVDCLVGLNGAGKTTLVKQVIGLIEPTSGRVTLSPCDLVANPGARALALQFWE